MEENQIEGGGIVVLLMGVMIFALPVMVGFSISWVMG